MEMKLLIAIFKLLYLITISHQAAVDNTFSQDTVVVEANKELRTNVIDTEANGECICVPYYLCNENKTIITDGANVIDLRVRIDTCSDALEVCCNRPLDQPEVTTQIPVRPDQKEDSDVTPTRPFAGCGRRNDNGVGVRIIGDINNESQYGEFPWMMAVLITDVVDRNTTLNVYQCGGSLIHPQVVMTAAHCVANVADKSKLIVRAGEWDTQTQNERFPHVNQRVSQVIIHEAFYSGGLFNDIALLVTSEPFNLSDNIGTICLPPQGFSQGSAICTATGWGKNEFGKKGEYQVILKKLNLPMVSRNECQNALRKTRVGRLFQLHESFVCAGGEPGRDTCSGDGGGPLVCPITYQPRSNQNSPLAPTNMFTRYEQTGIISWGIGCGTEVPGVYVNVALFRNWVDNWMRRLNFDTSFFTYNI